MYYFTVQDIHVSPLYKLGPFPPMVLFSQNKRLRCDNYTCYCMYFTQTITSGDVASYSNIRHEDKIG